jgi:hypothetical protein
MRNFETTVDRALAKPLPRTVQPKAAPSVEHPVFRIQRQCGNRAARGILHQVRDASAVQMDKEVGKKSGVRLPYITIKRKDISLKGEDKYGHWWTEIDGESYGWWPKTPVGLSETLFGTQGELNGMTSFGGSATRDPHHGDSADEQFHPVLSAAGKTEAQVKKDVRRYAKAYHGEWRWTLGWGQNCRTFQIGLMQNVGLKEP